MRGEQEQLALLLAVCDATPDGVYVKDLSGTYLYANRTCCELLNVSAEQLVGTTDGDWFGAETGARIRERDAEVLASGASRTFDEELPTPAGVRLFSTVKAPYKAPDGTIIGILGISRDVTEQRHENERVRAERDRLAGIADVLPGALVTYRLTPEGRIEVPFVSRHIEKLFGATPTEFMADPARFTARTDQADFTRGRARLAQSAQQLSEFHATYRVRHPDGVERWIDSRGTPMRRPDGSILWHGVMLDITELKVAELRLQSVLETVPDQVLLVDRERRIRFANRVWDGYSEETLLGTRVDDWVHPDQRELTQAMYDRAFATGELQTYESHVAGPDGEYRVLNVRIAPMRDHGEVVGATVVATDITQRKRMEEDLHASRATLSSVLNTTPDILLSIDREMRITFINRPKSVPSPLGTLATDALTPETRGVAIDAIQRVLDGGGLEEYEAQMVERLGGQWVHTRVGPIVKDAKIVGATLSGSDLTARKRAERELHESQERYQRLIELLPDAVFVHVGGKIMYANRAFLRMRGIAELGEILGRSPFEVFHPDDHQGIRERLALIRSVRGPIGPLACKMVGVDGVMRPVSVVATALPDAEHLAVVVVLHDLSALERSDLMLRSVLESVSDAILTIDTHGIVLAVNPAVTRLFGYAPDELVGQNVKMLMPPEVRDHHDGYLDAYMRTGVAKIVGIGREVTALRKDGRLVPCDLMVTSFRLNGKLHFTGVMRDITERKRLEEQFRQAHKMEAFGQLAGGVAHDFNNLLTVILGAAELLAGVGGPQSAEEVRTSVGDIQDAARRAADLTHQLLAFSRKTVLAPRILDINESIRESEKILRRLIGEDITLVTRLDPALPRVFVDPGQLTQVVMNLCLNGRDAMPAGGRLEIETGHVILDASSAAQHGLAQPGSYVRLTVRDSGTGMSEDVLAKVFQPFFTTKGLGRGTGLGLAVVQGVVTQSGGAVAVQSTIGVGTTFEILLPAAPAQASPAVDESRTTPLRGHETVLVVEDDEAVRRLAVRTLKSRGHNVLVAEDGEVALRVLAEHAPTIDIAVVDVVMPRLDGQRLAKIMEQRYPHVAVLFVSGYTDDMLENRGLDSAQRNFLNKPYTAASLTHAVRQALEQRTRR